MLDNVGKWDAAIRLVAGLMLFILAAVYNGTPIVSLLAALGGVLMAGTALTRKCPLYAVLGLSTCPRQRHH